ncbi:uncharacterized protein JN550_008129 [Neoarthrinium moseri]|uniref:uncharacterized protein n=1 Tax=Neoarthrinium moseri TaxID=1658444 RepID=UPI001FDE7056|nr:uncharacterized protein JN550_008129 [Neoarthrinium moseri]KAI1865871.1 hypothetical protein JN550_008129 [Neoarthrinium moseri]
MPKVRSSRRVPPLKESDIDHEINLVDHSVAGSSRAVSPSPDDDADHDNTLTSFESRAPLADAAAPLASADRDQAAQESVPGQQKAGEDHKNDTARDRPATPTVEPPTPAPEGGPSATTEHHTEPLPSGNGVKKQASIDQVKRHPRPRTPETAIDILYENERGGFFCGIPLFSSAALGNLDPAPWTNSAHKPSPTNIRTAQVPDPSWQWAWPSWRVNHDDAIEADKDGWEYSFMFARKFSWHGPRWYNSFVRRRAWIRRRIKKDHGPEIGDPHLLNMDYFTVTSPAAKRHSRHGSSVTGASERASRASVFTADDDAIELQFDIEDIETLLELLRRSRIDREKLDAVQNYLEHAHDDLSGLEAHMHEIMSIFVFQASRRLLLTRLMEVHDGYTHLRQKQDQTDEPKGPTPPTVRLQAVKSGEDDAGGAEDKETGASPGDDLTSPATANLPADEDPARLGRRVANLADAINHADEEVRRLEYWSDVKGMAENAASGGAVDEEHGWQAGWEGIDRSGGLGANKEELP